MVAYICSLNMKKADTEDCCKLKASQVCKTLSRNGAQHMCVRISENTQHSALEDRSDRAVHSPCHADGRLCVEWTEGHTDIPSCCGIVTVYLTLPRHPTPGPL